MQHILSDIMTGKKTGKKRFSVLVDPDKISLDDIPSFCSLANEAEADFIMAGGSLMISNQLNDVILNIKEHTDIPVILFPGSPNQVSSFADGILYLSLISGRNPELLIGQHVISAPIIRQSGLEVLSTGYMLIDGGAPTTASYISNAAPIPSDKNDIAVCTAMAGEMLGMKLIYLDAGSGAKRPISESMISSVSKNISIPLIVGGGIREPEKAYLNCKAGADIIVVGNAIEKDLTLLKEMSDAIHSVSIHK
ncbi:MAG: geranylgeranylglyceryl/heptaprenylglyceryl phosphate synthase [Chitinophagaceae bacterium]